MRSMKNLCNNVVGKVKAAGDAVGNFFKEKRL